MLRTILQSQIVSEPNCPWAAGPRHGDVLTAIEVPGQNRRALVVERLAVSSFVSLLALISGGAALGFESVMPSLLLAGSSIIGISTAACAIGYMHLGSRGVGPDTLREYNEKIEELEDLRWQARDNADQLRALLDAQEDIVLRRDTQGRITFANRAFCSKFHVRLEDVLGKPFHPHFIATAACERAGKHEDADLPDWARCRVEKVRTSDGARWIEWSHRLIEGPARIDGGTKGSIQSHGRDVTEQRRHERDLAVARDEARSANVAKSRFLASMSHEIRTPMNGILGMAGLLQETGLSPEQRTYTQAVRKSAVTLLALIDEILDFSKIEAGRVELVSEPVDVVDCVQSAVELLAPRAFQKGLQFAWSMAPDMPRMFLGDETRLRQILLNLIGNAVKFTEEGGVSVWVGTECLDSGQEMIRIAVRDTGPGLSAEASARIFREFERAVPKGALHESGTGLGLAIAQRLAHSMDGAISVSSELGRGALFTLSICLPRAQQDVSSATAPLAASSKLANRHVAVVSREKMERRTIANFMRAHNIAVSEFTELSELSSLRLAAQQTLPDTILIDCAADPIAARDSLENLFDANQAPLAAVMASTGNRIEFERFRASGIDNFLVRPIRPATLLALLSGDVSKTDSECRNDAQAQIDGQQVSTDVDLKMRPLRVLVAEDNEINALLARTVLTRLGCEPIVVANGSEAIDEVTRSICGETAMLDVVLMDLHMPIVDGLEATAEIKRRCTAAGAETPLVVAVTANAFQEDRDRCLAAGMDAYLAKPFEPGDLKRVLAGLQKANPN